MFQGSIPQDMRRIIHEIVADWTCPDVAIGCSGNFTIERILADDYSFNLRGSDVTIYSCAIGSYLADKPFRLELRDEQREQLGWLEPYLQTPAGGLATIQLMSKLTEAMDANGKLKDNQYYRRLLPAYRRQWDEMYTKTVEKIEAVTLRLKEFHAGDAVDWVAGLGADVGVISYPPFFTGGYEKMFERLGAVFDWDEPDYIMFDPASQRMDDYLQSIMNRKHWIFGLPEIRDDYADYLRGLTYTTLHGVPLYVYSNTPIRRIVTPKSTGDKVLIPRLMPGDVITKQSKIGLKKLSAGEFSSLRSKYLNVRIKTSSPSLALGVIVDGLLVGAIAFNPPKSYGTASSAYMLSDFAVAPTDYRRLSKLVLYAARSKETQRHIEAMLNRRVRTLVTTAFTDNPVSMKYRGLFDFMSRKETPAGGTSPYKYMVNYTAKTGTWTLQEGLDEWVRKHAKK